MTVSLAHPFPKLRSLPATLPIEGAIAIEIQDGIPVLRASTSVQNRIETLLLKQRESKLTTKESEEFDRYEEIDDYISFLNRLVRNQLQTRTPRDA